MNNLTIEEAVFVETDFKRFNPAGFRRVKDAVEIAGLKKAMARDAVDTQVAVDALRHAHDLSISEQRLAVAEFERQRQEIFSAISETFGGFAVSLQLNDEQARCLEGWRTQVALKFRQKEFGAVRQLLKKVDGLHRTSEVNDVRDFAPSFSKSSARTAPRRFPPKGLDPISLTALFQFALALEREGRVDEAIEAYQRVLARNKNHFKAKNRLASLLSRSEDRRF